MGLWWWVTEEGNWGLGLGCGRQGGLLRYGVVGNGVMVVGYRGRGLRLGWEFLGWADGIWGSLGAV